MKHRKEKQQWITANTLNYILCKSNKSVHWKPSTFVHVLAYGCTHLLRALSHSNVLSCEWKSEIFSENISLDSYFVCVQWQKKEIQKASEWKRKTKWGTCSKRIALQMQAKINGNGSRYHRVSRKKSSAHHTTPLHVQTASEITKAYNKVFSLLFPFSICFSAFYFSLALSVSFRVAVIRLVSTIQHQFDWILWENLPLWQPKTYYAHSSKPLRTIFKRHNCN